MKVTEKAPAEILPGDWRPAVVAAWRALGAPIVGGAELEAIQREINGAQLTELPGPAGIAGELARAGAELRHPEIIEADALWRKAQLQDRLKEFAGLAVLLERELRELDEAQAAINQLENLRVRFMHVNDVAGLQDLKEMAFEARQRAVRRAVDSSASTRARDLQTEVAEWLRVWLETPSLFVHWLELRKRSPEFSEKFDAD